MMAQVVSTRPTGITIIAWLWIATGGLMIFSTVMGGLAYSMMPEMGPRATMPPNIPAGFALMNTVFEHFGFLLAIQFLVALVAIAAGIYLLRLRSWARTTIEIMSWLAFIYSVGFGIYWVYMWVSMTGQISQGTASGNVDIFQIMGAVMGAVVTAVFAVPLGIMIKYLRGPVARAAITRAGSTLASDT